MTCLPNEVDSFNFAPGEYIMTTGEDNPVAAERLSGDKHELKLRDGITKPKPFREVQLADAAIACWQPAHRMDNSIRAIAAPLVHRNLAAKNIFVPPPVLDQTLLDEALDNSHVVWTPETVGGRRK